MIRDGVVRHYADLARLGYVTRARITQIMNLLNLAPDIQEEILFLARTVTGRDPVSERSLRRVTAIVRWEVGSGRRGGRCGMPRRLGRNLPEVSRLRRL